MIDRENVIRGLECCMLSYKDGCDECPYIAKGMCQELLGEHAIALLKAQEPVKPVMVNGEPECGACRYELRADADSYCPCCGRAVKWE